MAPIEEKSSNTKGENAAEAPEDLPVVKQLKELDDKYLALEREYKKEVNELTKKYTEKQRPLLEERRDMLTKCEGSPKTGTPALEGFWLKAMKHHPELEDVIMEWDEPVLNYLVDMEKTNLDDDDGDKGFKIAFKFLENPYFTNKELTKEWHTEETNPYCGEIDPTKIEATKIDWKPGMNVTVEKVTKKVKGGGAKKAKQRKEKEEPRPSFFRSFIPKLEQGMKLTEELRVQAESLQDEDDEEEDDDEMLEAIIQHDYELGLALGDNIIPFAVRWYTGEAAPEMDDDDLEDEEEEEEDDDSDEDESEEEMPKGKAKAKAKAGAGQKKKTSPKSSPKMKPSDEPN